MLHADSNAARFARFLIVGGTATVVQFTVLAVLVELAIAPAVAASAMGYGAGAVVNYLLNRSFTFRSAAPHLSSVPRFAAMAAMGLALNTAVYAILHGLGLHYLAAQVFTTLCVLLFNFTVASRWVFADRSVRSAQSEDAP
ncbi:MAG: GtrA family protein [Hyphomicrobiaceae bacterium]